MSIEIVADIDEDDDSLPPVNPYKNPADSPPSDSKELPPVNPYKNPSDKPDAKSSGSESSDLPPVNPYKNPQGESPGMDGLGEVDGDGMGQQNEGDLPPVNPYKNGADSTPSDSKELPPVNPYKNQDAAPPPPPGKEGEVPAVNVHESSVDDWDKPNVYGKPPPDGATDKISEKEKPKPKGL